ncbi:MAG: hypothetical protein ABEI98_11310 [Halorhabdus sp.]
MSVSPRQGEQSACSVTAAQAPKYRAHASPTMASFLTDLIESVLELPGKFLDVATHDPISAVLLGFGALFVGLAVAAGGVLTLRAVVESLSPFRPAREHRPRGR